jgi:hypothetical protein
MVEKVHFFDGKKFMWDSKEYSTKKEAKEAKKQYLENGFDVQSLGEDGKVLLYTRRVVAEVTVE